MKRVIYHITQSNQSDWKNLFIKEDASEPTNGFMIWGDKNQIKDLQNLAKKIKKVIFDDYEVTHREKPIWMNEQWLNEDIEIH